MFFCPLTSERTASEHHFLLCAKVELTLGVPGWEHSEHRESMSKQIAQQPTTEPRTNQTPFERFKAAAAEVLSFPKTSLKSPKKSTRKLK
jgi:hypothetical protein